MDIKDELDASFGDGPPLRPVTDAITAGRAALRRRRLGAGAATLAVVVVMGGTAYAAAGGRQQSSRDADRAVATQGAEPVDEFLDEVPVGLDRPDCDLAPENCTDVVVDFDPQGRLLRAEGVRITRLELDPVLRGETQRSAAVEAVHEGTTLWLFVQWLRGGGSSFAETAEQARDHEGRRFTDFDAWLAAGKAPGGWGGITSEPEDPDSFAAIQWWDPPTGRLVVPESVEVLQRVENPLGHTAPHDSAGLVVRHRGTVYWLLTDQQLTDGDGGSGASWVEAGDAVHADFESWLADQVAMENGEAPGRQRTTSPPTRRSAGRPSTPSSTSPGVRYEGGESLQ